MEYNFDEAKTFKEVLAWASSFLEKNNKESNAAVWLMKERFHLTQTELIFKGNETMSEQAKNQYKKDLDRFTKDYPAQYIIGHEWFYDRLFEVNEDVLIPRPETEEWFDRYLKIIPEKPLTVADIGTGSGVLAISHKLERPEDKVFAVDMSEKALAIAEKNAKNFRADVNFLQGDLTQPLKNRKFDLIISNPPYISESEWNEMDDSVRLYEPKQALFAEDEGLSVYKKLAKEIPPLLRSGGIFIVEIGYKQGKQVKEILASVFIRAEINIWKDLSGLDRAVYVKSP